MKLTFLGANHEVTGSCTMLEAAGQRFLIDYGMEQGKNVYENQPLPVAPGEIDFVLHHPCPYRPYRSFAAAGAQRLPGQDLRHHPHRGAVRHHAAGLGAYSGV